MEKLQKETKNIIKWANDYPFVLSRESIAFLGLCNVLILKSTYSVTRFLFFNVFLDDILLLRPP